MADSVIDSRVNAFEFLRYPLLGKCSSISTNRERTDIIGMTLSAMAERMIVKLQILDATDPNNEIGHCCSHSDRTKLKTAVEKRIVRESEILTCGG